MMWGGGIALALISLFLSGVDEPHPDWPKYWMIRPLIIVPIAGALGGAFTYFMDGLRYQGGWLTAFGYVLTILGYIVAVWMGSVLGLDGTMWN
jgi:hypothetical protein